MAACEMTAGICRSHQSAVGKASTGWNDTPWRWNG